MNPPRVDDTAGTFHWLKTILADERQLNAGGHCNAGDRQLAIDVTSTCESLSSTMEASSSAARLGRAKSWCRAPWRISLPDRVFLSRREVDVRSRGCPGIGHSSP
jgi:hypothetical protein